MQDCDSDLGTQLPPTLPWKGGYHQTTMFTVVLGVVVAVLLVVVFLFKKYVMPTPAPVWPVVSGLKVGQEFNTDPATLLRRLQKEHGPRFVIQVRNVTVSWYEFMMCVAVMRLGC